MMTEHYQCDRCGDQPLFGLNFSHFKLWFKGSRHPDRHLCRECYFSFLEFLESTPEGIAAERERRYPRRGEHRWTTPTILAVADPDRPPPFPWYAPSPAPLSAPPSVPATARRPGYESEGGSPP